jgi:hypothetical protein
MVPSAIRLFYFGGNDMKQEKIKVLMVAPGEYPKEVVLKNNLDALQKAVSIGCDYQGLIEVISLGKGVCIICNEEGKLLGLEGNRRLGGDIIAGVFYVVGEDKCGNFAISSFVSAMME